MWVKHGKTLDHKPTMAGTGLEHIDSEIGNGLSLFDPH
jgi:hypothetical protein